MSLRSISGTLVATKLIMASTCSRSNSRVPISSTKMEAEGLRLSRTNTDCFGMARCTRALRTLRRLEMVLANSPSNPRSEEHTSELQSRENLVCRLLLEKRSFYQECQYVGFLGLW